jgi:tRNA pseudouridine38-40 synthase
MDVEALQRSAAMFEGRHDFLSFAATDPDLASRNLQSDLAAGQPSDLPPEAPGKEGSFRTVYSSVWEQRQSEQGGLLIYRVRGNGFLHHMVRNLVGTMLDVGRGQLDIEQIPFILAARARSAAGPTAPAQGLFLHSVEYDEQEVTLATE